MTNDIYESNGLACSLSLVQLATEMRKLDSGELFEFTTDNPCFEGDIRIWSQETGNKLCNFRQEKGKITVVIMKK
jgi:TusA-related sulfurtransferase